MAIDSNAIVRRQKPQTALLQRACGVGHNKSRRRPYDLTSEQAASIKRHPIIVKLRRRYEALRRGGSKTDAASARVIYHRESERLRRNLRNKIRADWTTQQAIADIESQLHGRKLPEVQSDPGPPRSPAQELLLVAIAAPQETTVEGHLRRRNTAISAVARYCKVVEPPVRRKTQLRLVSNGIHPTVSDIPAQATKASSPLHRTSGMLQTRSLHSSTLDEAIILSVFVRSQEERSRRCFLCVGDAMGRHPEDPSIEYLTHEYYSSSEVSRHFNTRHLRYAQPGRIWCGACEMSLDNEQHLQNHALTIHGIKTPVNPEREGKGKRMHRTGLY